MKRNKIKSEAGFSLIELVIAMTVMLIALGIISTVMSKSFAVRARESRTTDALSSAQAALNVLSRDIGNSGYGIYDVADETKYANNGIVIADSNDHKLRVRANLSNAGGTPLSPGVTTLTLNAPNEDITYFFDAPTKSIVRYDPNGGGTGVPITSVVVNRISDVTFQYYDYAGATSAVAGPFAAPSANTGRVEITVTVTLDPVQGQPNPAGVTFRSEVTLRNNRYMLQQY
jgi:prepilin-type N-terminal cleavage/methylation domain-containing protein